MHETHEGPSRRGLYRRMVPRRVDEPHRAATPLELFFDLCFVVAIALAAANLHHEVVDGHVGDGVLGFAMVFFAIWWAWVNFTWFASAYDTDDPLYRLMTFVQMSGALVLAAGVPRAFEDTDLSLMTAGYVVMRFAMVTQWLRAAHTDPEHRSCALRYAVGVSIVQVLWVGRLALPHDIAFAGILPLVIAELAVPVWAEHHHRTSWHPLHIVERHGLFTIIVLGESILASTIALQVAFDSSETTVSLVSIAIGGLVIVFSMWWLYFGLEENRLLDSFAGAFFYGYGHLPVFAAAAAAGAGIAVIVEHETGHGHISDLTAALAIAVPVAIYVAGVWFVRILPNTQGILRVAFPACAGLVLACAPLGAPVVSTAVLLALLVAVLVRVNAVELEAASID